MSVSAAQAAEEQIAAYSPTAEETRFMRRLLPTFNDLGVTVQEFCHMPGSGELHLTLLLPATSRPLREKVLTVLQDLEQAFAYSVTVIPTLLHPEDNED